MQEILLRETKIVAHRGASYAAPENTIPSFELAFKENADFIEGDFWLTKDKEIVCVHDSNTARVNKEKIKLKINKSTLAELKNIDAGSWKGEEFKETQIPSIQEVLQIIPEGKGIFVEIKDNKEEFIKILFNILNSSGFPHGKIRIISFDPRMVAAVKRHIPEVKAYWLFSWFSFKVTCNVANILGKFNQAIKAIKCDGINVNAACGINKNFVNELRKQQLDFSAYNVDEPDVLQKMLSLGVDAVTTNYPNKMREQMNTLLQSSSHAHQK